MFLNLPKSGCFKIPGDLFSKDGKRVKRVFSFFCLFVLYRFLVSKYHHRIIMIAIIAKVVRVDIIWDPHITLYGYTPHAFLLPTTLTLFYLPNEWVRLHSTLLILKILL